MHNRLLKDGKKIQGTGPAQDRRICSLVHKGRLSVTGKGELHTIEARHSVFTGIGESAGMSI